MPKNTTSVPEAEEVEGHPAMTMGGVAPTKTATDSWVTAMPKADATDLSSLPKAVADAIDGKDHFDDVIVPDDGGHVFDTTAATANAAADAK